MQLVLRISRNHNDLSAPTGSKRSICTTPRHIDGYRRGRPPSAGGAPQSRLQFPAGGPPPRRRPGTAPPSGLVRGVLAPRVRR
jgi:hypothetical protein